MIPGWVKTAAKLAVVGLCLGVVARTIDLASLKDVLANPAWLWFVPPILMVWLEPLLSAKKWHVLMAHNRETPPIGELSRVLYVSNFLALLTPTAIGADALRVFMLRRRGYRIFQTVSSMLMDRVVALCVLLGLALVGWVFARHALPPGGLRLAIPAICCAVLGGVALFYFPPVARLYRSRRAAAAGWYRHDRHPLRRWPKLHALGETIGTALDRLVEAFQDYRGRPAAMLEVVGWNLALQGMRILQVHFLFLALRHPVPLAQELAFVPLVIILVMLPISYFGIGIKEGAFVFLFSRAGVPVETCLAVSILTYPVILTGLLPGLVLFLTDRRLGSVREVQDAARQPAPEEPS